MSALQKGLILAAIQVAIVASLGAKLAVDRARLPRAWARTRTYDPDLPIRGRYLSVQLLVHVDAANTNPTPNKNPCYFSGRLSAHQGQLEATLDDPADEGSVSLRSCIGPNRDDVTLATPVLFFLPEHAKDPLSEARGGELWAEVSVPRKGPPRPIRLAVKRGDKFIPLDIQ
jgi:hypothetical protein